jgi:hypothetical protein
MASGERCALPFRNVGCRARGGLMRSPGAAGNDLVTGQQLNLAV